MFLPELKAKRGKCLMHSNDHVKENWAPIEGGSTPYPFGGITVWRCTDPETFLLSLLLIAHLLDPFGGVLLSTELSVKIERL